MRILARGFSITRDRTGNVIRDAVPDGTTIVSETSTSLITSTVTGSELRDREEET